MGDKDFQETCARRLSPWTLNMRPAPGPVIQTVLLLYGSPLFTTPLAETLASQGDDPSICENV